jgi:hypothetical protein
MIVVPWRRRLEVGNVMGRWGWKDGALGEEAHQEVPSRKTHLQSIWKDLMSELYASA